MRNQEKFWSSGSFIWNAPKCCPIDFPMSTQPRVTNMKSILLAFTAAVLLGIGTASASEITCGSTGGMNRCPLPGADMMKVKVKQVLEGKCAHETGWWADSDDIVVDKGCIAVFKYSASASTSGGTDAIASAYYDDGCKAGKADKKAGLSMAYERHDGAYDTANAGSYEAGYNKCWMKAK